MTAQSENDLSASSELGNPLHMSPRSGIDPRRPLRRETATQVNCVFPWRFRNLNIQLDLRQRRRIQPCDLAGATF